MVIGMASGKDPRAKKMCSAMPRSRGNRTKAKAASVISGVAMASMA